MYNPKFRLPTLFQDISKYVSIYFVEPTVYWSSGWSYQGMGHQESPDSHLWPQGSFPGCQENQGLISKNKSYCYNFNACIYPLHVPSPRVVWKNESFMKIQLNVLFIQDHLCNITSFSPCLKKVFSFYVYRNLSLYTLYKYIKKNSIFHLKHDKNMFLFSQTSAFQRNILASVSYDFTTRWVFLSV